MAGVRSTTAASSGFLPVAFRAMTSSGSLYGNTSAPTTAPTQSMPPSNTAVIDQNSTGRSAEISSTSTYDAVDTSLGAPSIPLSTSINSAAAMSSAAPNFTTSAGTSTNQTADVPYNHNGEFWAGADIGTVLRAEALPGRTFYDYDGKTVKDPIKTLGDAGLNAFRVVTSRGDCLGPQPFVNNATSLADELVFKLDFGCIATKVEIVKQATTIGMKMQLTINQGFNIPKGMEKYTYMQMVDEVRKRPSVSYNRSRMQALSLTLFFSRTRDRTAFCSTRKQQAMTGGKRITKSVQKSSIKDCAVRFLREK